jgi:hypothetical protein
MHLVSSPADAAISLAATEAKGDCIATHLWTHFIDDSIVIGKANLRIGTPVDNVDWVRRKIPRKKVEVIHPGFDSCHSDP